MRRDGGGGDVCALSCEGWAWAGGGSIPEAHIVDCINFDTKGDGER